MTSTAPQLMLAAPTELRRDEAAKTLTDTGEWSAELKLDGIRACATIDGRSVRLTNRRGLDITFRYPDVVRRLAVPGIHAVIDGEIVVFGADARPDFAAVHRRDAQAVERSARVLAGRMPATFVAFDVLEVAGQDVCDQSYQMRRARLERLSGGLDVNPRSDDGQAMWAFVKERRLEGLVLKRKDSRYTGGRSSAWQKVKLVHTLSAVVCGTEPGKGHRARTFGALRLAVINDAGEIVEVGSVGSGFSNADCETIAARIRKGDLPIIVEVEYLEFPNGQLRQPVFRGLRMDLEVTDCTLSQLEEGSVSA